MHAKANTTCVLYIEIIVLNHAIRSWLKQWKNIGILEDMISIGKFMCAIWNKGI
jgi:hypothetical protein